MGKTNAAEPFEISEEELKKAQKKMLDMFWYFKEFCDKHGLLFYLCGGGAIGALREKGILPWDDDIDVLMPRPDYEKFKVLWERYGDKDRYVYCRTDRHVNYHHGAASLRDPNTTYISTYNQHYDLCHGIALDMIPMDGCPKNTFLQMKQFVDSCLFFLFNAQRLPNNKGKFLRAASWLIFKLVPSEETRYRLWKHFEKEASKYPWGESPYVREAASSYLKAMLNFYPRKWFASAVQVPFEDGTAPVPVGYERFMRMVFGNYMKRPPKQERVIKHHLVFADMDHSYKDYEGIYYFPDGKKTGGAM